MHVTSVTVPPSGSRNSWYASNREPLLVQPLVKLPLGAVRPHGWLKHQLELMATGMTGRLAQLSEYLAPTNGWFGGAGEGWEEQPYWLRGFYPLALLTGCDSLLAESRRWIEAVLASQDADGYFGAQFHKASPYLPGAP